MMRNFFVMAVAAAMLCGCEKEINVEEQSTIETADGTVVDLGPSKKFTFTMKGDFGNAVFVDAEETRGNRAAKYLDAAGNEMTDLWVFDYMGGTCIQTIHQTASDEAWGHPSLPLAYGSHHVYFVASRGTEPTLDATAKTITWTKPRDTFWKDYEVEVVSTSNGNRAVTLDRVVTKLKVTIDDEIPTGIASISLTPAIWYCSLNYQTGAPAGQVSNQERTVAVPANYVGTTGTLTTSIFGFSAAMEWTTDVVITAKDANSATLGTATITDAAFKRNRASEYSGPLFGSAGAATVSIEDGWLDALTGSW